MFRDFIAEQSFIRAIHADVRSLAPRWIYADWLEEQGDPRAEYLRLQCRLADPRERHSPDEREALSDRLREAEAEISLDWLAMIDAADKYTLMWPPGSVDHLGFVLDAKSGLRVLRWAAGEPTRERRRRPRKLHEGDYVYPLYLNRGSVYVVARMRISAVLEFDSFDATADAPEPSETFAVRGNHDLLSGDRGTESRMVHAPVELLEKLRFASSSGEHGLTLIEGRSARRSELNDVHRLTQSSAFAIDCLLAGAPSG
ncbi:MAG TPA: TIGR02996 domain-containing protein [Pirellulales bacterium]